MIPGKYPIKIYRGGTYRNRITAIDKASGLPLDFSKYTVIRMQVRPPWLHVVGGDKPAPLLELSLANGRISKIDDNLAIELYLAASVTEVLSFYDGVYDLEMISSGGVGQEDDVDKLFYGTVTVTWEATV